MILRMSVVHEGEGGGEEEGQLVGEVVEVVEGGAEVALAVEGLEGIVEAVMTATEVVAGAAGAALGEAGELRDALRGVKPRQEGEVREEQEEGMSAAPALEPGLLLATRVTTTVCRFSLVFTALADNHGFLVAPQPPARRRKVSRTGQDVAAPAQRTSSAAPNCSCGVSAAERTVVKESANKGRKFWTCGNSGECQFFEWQDGPSGGGGGGGGGGSGSTTTRAPASKRKTVCTSTQILLHGLTLISLHLLIGTRCGC